MFQENYDVEFLKQVYNSHQMDTDTVASLPTLTNVIVNKDYRNQTRSPFEPHINEKSIRVQYNSKDEFKKIAKHYGLMDDFKVSISPSFSIADQLSRPMQSGVPRTGYRGVVTLIHRGYRIYLAPSPMWSGYNVTWK